MNIKSVSKFWSFEWLNLYMSVQIVYWMFSCSRKGCGAFLVWVIIVKTKFFLKKNKHLSFETTPLFLYYNWTTSVYLTVKWNFTQEADLLSRSRGGMTNNIRRRHNCYWVVPVVRNVSKHRSLIAFFRRPLDAGTINMHELQKN